ncbi:hypothetical protein [Schlesneria sp. DSM 10557]|uniref:hypothetical protein n=1 Tax=Schlesneria sp. DSM 10557 TaxID=3044399 RepID=UPI0035A10D36
MNFELTMRVGFRGISHKLRPLSIAQHDIDHVGQFAGAYHVLEMGQHFRDYVEQGNMPAFPPIPGFPVTAYHEPLTNKQRAQGVTGNIGEAIAGIVSERVLKVPAQGIAHIRLQRPFQRRQCPDFMVRTGGGFPDVIAPLASQYGVTHCPTWWPLESKARVDGNGCKSATSDAFHQLAAYWFTIASGAHASDVGFGFVVTCAYDRNRGVCIRVFMPKNVTALQTHLRGFSSYESFVDAIKADDKPVKDLMYG